MKRTWLKRVNPRRRERLFARNYGERVHQIHLMPCLVWQHHHRVRRPTLVPQCRGDTVAAHVIARGMGGVKGDLYKLVALCAKHHDEAGEYGTSQREEFERRYGLDLMAEADRLAEELDESRFHYGAPA